MAEEIRAGFPTMPPLAMPDVALDHSQNEIYLYQMDSDNAPVASTIAYGPCSFAMQAKVSVQFNMARYKCSTTAFQDDWCCITMQGAPVDTSVLADWLTTRYGIRVAGQFAAQWVDPE